jgi:hypothetical protein
MNSLVRDMMTTDVVTVEPSTPFREIVSAADRASSRRRTSCSRRSTRTPTWTSRWSGPGAVASSGGGGRGGGGPGSPGRYTASPVNVASGWRAP